MKKIQTKTTTAISLLALTAFFTGCDINKTESGSLPDIDMDVAGGSLPDIDVSYEEGSLPDVDMDIDAGSLPEFDVEWADVDFGMKTKTVRVPKVGVYFEEEEVSVPVVDVAMPGDADYGDVEEQQLTVKAKMPRSGYKLKVMEVLRADDELVIISGLQRVGSVVDSDKDVPMQDTIVVNSPRLDKKHYILTNLDDVELDGVDAEIVNSRKDIDIDWKRAKGIYKARS